MFRMGIPNQSAEDQRKQVRKAVRNSFFSFVAIIGLIRACKFKSNWGIFAIVYLMFLFTAPYVIEAVTASSLWDWALPQLENIFRI